MFNSLDCSIPGFPVLHGLPNFAQTHVNCREGNGTPLQYSCLENPRAGGAWWAVIYGVAQSRTQLKQFSSSSSNMSIESVMPSNHLILCHPLLFLPSIFHSIRVFSNELDLHIRWQKCWTLASASVLPINIQG